MGGVAAGLDYGAVMTFADAQGVDLELLTDVLPEVENSIVAAMNGDSDED